MSTFVKEACKFVQAMFEPILVDGLSGKVSAEVLDGYIDIWVPVSKRDQRRLEPNYWAFNTLIQTLAQVLASELPDGVTSDAIAIRRFDGMDDHGSGRKLFGGDGKRSRFPHPPCRLVRNTLLFCPRA